ncbi:FMN-binding negative transcriptional regulator [Paenibacillus sp. IB182496]|uniref:FMN-binding negative transcriptional regulator n=1 Tax=Paenibacillus sabuli TaxID=2772509 RepID=A0A927GQ72_9BACL|nr:FMN-binding negative transcriptional regulator [Paenibacillus sabuli]MBD2843585.1 FMN-binding negative transcriptional regulator [Paenibacillus sabuli]
MYIPKPFQMEDESVMFDFIEQHNFGILITTQAQHPVGSHLPFWLDREQRRMYSHFARPNEQWRDIEDQEALIIFPGPHTYISPTWYETNQSVPTWNYVSVHVYGKITIIDDPSEVLGSLGKLVLQHEGPDSAYTLDSSNQAFVEGLSAGIVAFQCEIAKLEGKWKLSQNHSRARQENVVRQLEQSKHEDARSIAAQMKRNLEGGP